MATADPCRYTVCIAPLELQVNTIQLAQGRLWKSAIPIYYFVNIPFMIRSVKTELHPEEVIVVLFSASFCWTWCTAQCWLTAGRSLRLNGWDIFLFLANFPKALLRSLPGPFPVSLARFVCIVICSGILQHWCNWGYDTIDSLFLPGNYSVELYLSWPNLTVLIFS